MRYKLNPIYYIINNEPYLFRAAKIIHNVIMLEFQNVDGNAILISQQDLDQRKYSILEA